jgi:hypothetical protein
VLAKAVDFVRTAGSEELNKSHRQPRPAVWADDAPGVGINDDDRAAHRCSRHSKTTYCAWPPRSFTAATTTPDQA